MALETGPKSGLQGNGRNVNPRPFAIPIYRLGKGKGGPYLKTWGSRPEYKRRTVRRAA